VTLGEYFTIFIVLVAITVVPYKILRAWWPEIRHLIMSTSEHRSAPTPVVARPVVQQVTFTKQPIATTDNEDNGELPDNRLLSESLPTEVRDIIRFQGNVEMLARQYRAGLISNLAVAIEKSFECSRSSKEGSTYQRVHRAIKPLIDERPDPEYVTVSPTRMERVN
jgi:hypothetical protein